MLKNLHHIYIDICVCRLLLPQSSTVLNRWLSSHWPRPMTKTPSLLEVAIDLSLWSIKRLLSPHAALADILMPMPIFQLLSHFAKVGLHLLRCPRFLTHTRKKHHRKPLHPIPEHLLIQSPRIFIHRVPWPIANWDFIQLLMDIREPSSGDGGFHGVVDVEWAVDDLTEGVKSLSPVCKLGGAWKAAVVAEDNYAGLDLVLVSLR